MAKVAQKSPIKSKPLAKKADTSSSSSSSSDSDDEPQQQTKASATKASKLPVAAQAKSTPAATPNTNDKKRPKESSSSSSSSSEDEAPVSKKMAMSQPASIAPVPKQAYPSKVQPQKQQNDVAAIKNRSQPEQQHKQLDIPSKQQHAANRINEVPMSRQVNDVQAKTQVTVRVNTNFETPCPHCGHKLEINMNIA